MLTGEEILRRLGTDIEIDPFNEEQLNPNSYNLRLHDTLLVYTENECLDMRKDNKTKRIVIPDEGLILKPGKLYLGRTFEHTKTRNLVPILSGRSSVGRLGISIHVTAGFGDVGFCGFWTLEITAVEPVKIYPFCEICQIYYEPAIGKQRPYEGKYQNNHNVQKSMMYKDFLK